MDDAGRRNQAEAANLYRIEFAAELELEIAFIYTALFISLIPGKRWNIDPLAPDFGSAQKNLRALMHGGDCDAAKTEVV